MTNASVRRLLSESSYAAGPALIVLVLLVANIIWQSSFIDSSNWASTLALASPFVLTALAQTPPVLSGQGGLDLSVGPFAGFVSIEPDGTVR